ncbi:MAG TPA: DUF3341 domain-containing protein [Verrucomicrobiae bacterium]|nr:DUF3341 domain-containing protein [Verrucomicrobiae bacterium]
MKTDIHGLMAEFVNVNELLAAAKAARDHGYRRMDAYTPFPVEDLAEHLGRKKSRVPLIVLIAAICGGTGGYFMQWYAAVIDYPLNVAGRPLHTWPAFIPITFELTILSGALAGLLGMLLLNRLPQLYHPVFNAPGFARASTDKFFLCIESSDPKFDLVATRKFLETFRPVLISEVPA